MKHAYEKYSCHFFPSRSSKSNSYFSLCAQEQLLCSRRQQRQKDQVNSGRDLWTVKELEEEKSQERHGIGQLRASKG